MQSRCIKVLLIEAANADALLIQEALATATGASFAVEVADRPW